MKELELKKLYEEADNSTVDYFMSKINSNAKINIDYENYLNDIEWIDIVELTLPYIDNILRSPNRFIVNEEEIVKIELARKITVDSIKHLSKHTNLIQEVDENDDVRPSRILNVYKEESFDTYENKLIYTLIQNLKMFCAKKRKLVEENLKKDMRDEKKLTYIATSRMKNEDVAINMSITTALNMPENEKQRQKNSIISRIDKIEKKINELTFTDVYKELDKMNIRLIRPPIKKTNLILKNVNFQYATKLWDYIQDHLDNPEGPTAEHREYIDEGIIKQVADETFFMDYLAVNTLNKEKNELDDQKMTKEEIVEYLLERLISMNADLTVEQIKELIGDKFEQIKYKKAATLQEIQAIFKKSIDEYMQKLA